MIKDLSETRYLPRIGKVKMGFRDPERNMAPHATDYLVCPPEVTEVYGEKPVALTIMFPVNDREQICPQYYKAYSSTRGLICKGDGVKCMRLCTKGTEAWADRDSKDVENKELKCPGQACPKLQAKGCKPVMNLQFMLPEVPGLGVYQLDTSSIYSIINVNSELDFIAATVGGRVAMIPLRLTMEPKEVTPKENGGKKKTVQVIHIRTALGVTFDHMQRLAAGPVNPYLLEAPEDNPEVVDFDDDKAAPAVPPVVKAEPAVTSPAPPQPEAKAAPVKQKAATIPASQMPDNGDDLWARPEEQPAPKPPGDPALASLWAAICNITTELKAEKAIAKFLGGYAVEVKDWNPGVVPEGLTAALAKTVKANVERQREVVNSKKAPAS